MIIFTRCVSVPLVVYNSYIIAQDVLEVVYFVVFEFSLYRSLVFNVSMSSGVRRQLVVRKILDICFFGMGLLPVFGAEVPLFVASAFPIFVTRNMQAENTF